MVDTARLQGIEAIETELAFYTEKKEELLAAHEGKYALIKGRELLGLFDTFPQAYEAGLRKVGNKPMLIKQVLRQEPVEHFPALEHGLIRARS